MVKSSSNLVPYRTQTKTAADGPVIAAMAVWLGLAAVIGMAAFVAGEAPRLIGAYVCLMAAPALFTLWVAPSWGGIAAQAAIGAMWIGAAAAGVQLSGGLASPAWGGFVVAPALAWRLAGAERGREVFVFTLGAMLVAAIAPHRSAADFDTPLPGLASALGIALGLWLCIWSRPAAQTRRNPSLHYAKLGHELRTPLNHIIGFAELMEGQILGPLSDRYRDYAVNINQAGRHLLELVNTLIDLGKWESGAPAERSRIAPSDAVRDVIQGAEISARAKSISLSSDLHAAPAWAFVDAKAWRQILYNLLGNAVKFSPEDGAVQVRLFTLQRDLILEVEDNGPGVSDAMKARLGQEFVRGEGASDVEGAGLGLSLVRALAQAHDGVVSFHDAEPHGLIVRVSLADAISA